MSNEIENLPRTPDFSTIADYATKEGVEARLPSGDKISDGKATISSKEASYLLSQLSLQAPNDERLLKALVGGIDENNEKRVGLLEVLDPKAASNSPQGKLRKALEIYQNLPEPPMFSMAISKRAAADGAGFSRFNTNGFEKMVNETKDYIEGLEPEYQRAGLELVAKKALRFFQTDVLDITHVPPRSIADAQANIVRSLQDYTIELDESFSQELLSNDLNDMDTIKLVLTAAAFLAQEYENVGGMGYQYDKVVLRNRTTVVPASVPYIGEKTPAIELKNNVLYMDMQNFIFSPENAKAYSDSVRAGRQFEHMGLWQDDATGSKLKMLWQVVDPGGFAQGIFRDELFGGLTNVRKNMDAGTSAPLGIKKRQEVVSDTARTAVVDNLVADTGLPREWVERTLASYSSDEEIEKLAEGLDSARILRSNTKFLRGLSADLSRAVSRKAVGPEHSRSVVKIDNRPPIITRTDGSTYIPDAASSIRVSVEGGVSVVSAGAKDESVDFGAVKGATKLDIKSAMPPVVNVNTNKSIHVAVAMVGGATPGREFLDAYVDEKYTRDNSYYADIKSYGPVVEIRTNDLIDVTAVLATVASISQSDMSGVLVRASIAETLPKLAAKLYRNAPAVKKSISGKLQGKTNFGFSGDGWKAKVEIELPKQ